MPSGFLLYKIHPITGEWTEISYTVIDAYTIEVTLNIVGGELDPPFVLAEIDEGETLTGDANGDVDVADITRVAEIILLTKSPTSRADVNDDGNINIPDMTKTARIILGLD